MNELAPIRRENLKRLGHGPTELVNRLGSTYSYWRDLLAGDRSFGEKAARRIEAGLGLPARWLDEPHARHETPPPTAPAEPAPAPAPANAEVANVPRCAGRIPVVGTAKLGEDGYYEHLGYPPGQGDGCVPGFSNDPDAYALRVKGDSMHPAIRHGMLVVVAPNHRCLPGEYVAIQLHDGLKMVKELVFERAEEVVVESVNGNQRRTIDKADIERMHPVVAVVSASLWSPD